MKALLLPLISGVVLLYGCDSRPTAATDQQSAGDTTPPVIKRLEIGSWRLEIEEWRSRSSISNLRSPLSNHQFPTRSRNSVNQLSTTTIELSSDAVRKVFIKKRLSSGATEYSR